MSDSNTAAAPPVIVITDLVKHFGRFAALRGLTASFDAARIYVILGDNGAGKTTLLRTLAGLVRPTSGGVQVDGRVSNLLQIGSGFHPCFTGR